eukprot:458117-Karenia_brevis.AAC.1
MAGAEFSGRGMTSSAMVFFDFAAAFPSISHAFLWLALQFLGVPSEIISAIRALYAGNWHWLRFGRACIKAFAVQAGVKQGCPLSPILFVMVTDPFLCAMRSMLSPRSCLRAYADDIAVTLNNLWQEGPGIAVLFNAYS